VLKDRHPWGKWKAESEKRKRKDAVGEAGDNKARGDGRKVC